MHYLLGLAALVMGAVIATRRTRPTWFVVLTSVLVGLGGLLAILSYTRVTDSLGLLANTIIGWTFVGLSIITMLASIFVLERRGEHGEELPPLIGDNPFDGDTDDSDDPARGTAPEGWTADGRPAEADAAGGATAPSSTRMAAPTMTGSAAPMAQDAATPSMAAPMAQDAVTPSMAGPTSQDPATPSMAGPTSQDAVAGTDADVAPDPAAASGPIPVPAPGAIATESPLADAPHPVADAHQTPGRAATPGTTEDSMTDSTTPDASQGDADLEAREDGTAGAHPGPSAGAEDGTAVTADDPDIATTAVDAPEGDEHPGGIARG